MRNLKKYSNHSGYSADERALGYNVSICKNESHTHYDKPYDSKVAYLECTRGQWIDTGITFKAVQSFSFTLDFQDTDAYNYQALFCIGTDTVFEGWIQPGATAVRFNGVRSNNKAESLGRHIFNVDWQIGSYTWSLDGISETITSTSITSPTISNTLWLLHRVDYATGYLFGFSLIQDGIKVLDLIPVRVGQVGYMYDRVSKRLFGNSGTGTFILGPDI